MATRKQFTESLIAMVIEGVETIPVATEILDDMGIRGDFSGRAYCGFDYREQRWIQVDLSGPQVAPAPQTDLDRWNSLGHSAK
jgi:hypothetical protein